MDIDTRFSITDPKQQAKTLIGLAFASGFAMADPTIPTQMVVFIKRIARTLGDLWEADLNEVGQHEDGVTSIKVRGQRYGVSFTAARRTGLDILNDLILPIIEVNDVRTEN